MALPDREAVHGLEIEPHACAIGRAKSKLHPDFLELQTLYLRESGSVL